MSRAFSVLVLCTALGFLVASPMLAADKPTAKKPPPATAKDGHSHHGEKAARAKPAAKEKSRPAAVQPLPPGGNEALIEQALAMPTQLEFTDSPLSNVLDYLVDYHSQKLGRRFEIRIDTKALSDAGIAKDPLITMNLKGVSLRSALDLMLRDIQLTWTIEYEILLITTPEDADNRLTVKVLDVADLVVCRDSKGKLWDDYDSLTDLIKSTILPTTWDDVGGPASISPANLGAAKALVIAQTYPAQCDIADMLQKIRAIAKKTPDAGPPVRDKAPAPSARRGSCAAHRRRPAMCPKDQSRRAINTSACRNVRAAFHDPISREEESDVSRTVDRCPGYGPGIYRRVAHAGGG